ncbi:MAG: hypothetical protein KME46_32355 [Brasilonema angustatum HA4187-MV1]|jgi:hypothetical protein|nr:hypothetical protein [Brasilonema angustatum HA4187-MV1]
MAILQAELPYTLSKSLKTTIRLLPASPAIKAPSGFLNWKPRTVYLFGQNFTQDSTKFTINKADLPDLQPSANNSAEAILTALLYKAMQVSGNSSTSMINISVWKTVYKPTQQGRMKVIILEVNILIPAQYKYERVEIRNANDSNIVKYL